MSSEGPRFPPSLHVRRKDATATSDLGEEVVVLDLEDGRYFGLENVGALVWQLLGEGATVADIENAILEEFEVPREQCHRDLQDLLGQLSSRQLILTESP